MFLSLRSLSLHLQPSLTPNIKEQILVSFPHTFLIKILGEVIEISRKFTLDDHILNSQDLRGSIIIDVTGRNLMLITVKV